ncbi:GNAT family N-acetyltransferase [Actinomycetes bacterium KLBMP 9797]
MVEVPWAELDDETFARFYREVLVPSFPPEELVDLDGLRPTAGAFGTVVLRDGEPVAGALGDLFPDSGVLLLSYLAVRPGLRAGGFGGKLLGAELARWRQRAPEALILAEVEDPRAHAAGPHGDPVARLRFYDRLGARLLPLWYFQPALRPGADRVRGMLLIAWAPSGDVVEADVVARFLDEYVGASDDTDDPEYEALRAQLSAWPDGKLPLWPLSRLPNAPRP